MTLKKHTSISLTRPVDVVQHTAIFYVMPHLATPFLGECHSVIQPLWRCIFQCFCLFSKYMYIILTLKPFVKKNFTLFSWRWGCVATIKLVCYHNPCGFLAHCRDSNGALFSRFSFFSKYMYIILTFEGFVKKKFDLFSTCVALKRAEILYRSGLEPATSSLGVLP